MKKIGILFFIVYSFTAVAQKGVNFREGTFSEILKLAKAENKPVLYMCYASWCPHCQKMKKEVMTDSLVANFYNRNFICAMRDMEEGEGIALRKKFSVKSYPTFVYLNPDGETLYSISAELAAVDFIAEGKNALDPKKQFPYLKAQFLSDAGNADNCLAYIMALRKSGQNTNEVAKKYLSTQSDQQLISPVNWKIIANGVHDIDSREFQYVLKNQKEFAGVSSPIRVERKIVNMVIETLSPYVEASDTLHYFKHRASAAAIQLTKTDSLVYNFDIRILENTKNWEAYRKATMDSASKFSWKNPGQLKEIAMNYMNNVSDSEGLKQAILWAQRSLELKDSYDCYLILAKLYLKTGNKTAAKEWAEKGRKMAVNYQWNTVEADNILNQIK